MIRIAIQSDLELRRSSYDLLLKQYSGVEVVFQANNNDQLEAQLAQNSIDVVLYCSDNHIDFEALDQLSKKHPNLMVLLVTSSYTANGFQKVLDRKFMGYLVENTSLLELKKAIHQLHTKGYYYDQKLFDQHKKELRNSNLNGVCNDVSTIKLTKTERMLLPYFFRGMTTIKIGIKNFMSEETIKSHRRNILAKTNSKNMAGAIYTLLINGVVTLKELTIRLVLIFCLLINGLDFSDERSYDDLEGNSSYEWVKVG